MGAVPGEKEEAGQERQRFHTEDKHPHRNEQHQYSDVLVDVLFVVFGGSVLAFGEQERPELSDLLPFRLQEKVNIPKEILLI